MKYVIKRKKDGKYWRFSNHGGWVADINRAWLCNSRSDAAGYCFVGHEIPVRVRIEEVPHGK